MYAHVSKEEWMWRGLAIVNDISAGGNGCDTNTSKCKNRYTTVAVLEASQCYRSSQK